MREKTSCGAFGMLASRGELPMVQGSSMDLTELYSKDPREECMKDRKDRRREWSSNPDQQSKGNNKGHMRRESSSNKGRWRKGSSTDPRTKME